MNTLKKMAKKMDDKKTKGKSLDPYDSVVLDGPGIELEDLKVKNMFESSQDKD